MADIYATHINTIPYFSDSEPVARVRVKAHIEKTISESVSLSRDERKVPVLERKALKHQHLALMVGKTTGGRAVLNDNSYLLKRQGMHFRAESRETEGSDLEDQPR